LAGDTGKARWVQQFGGLALDVPLSIASSTDGDALVGITIFGDVQFGTQTVNATIETAVDVKLGKDNGNVIWSHPIRSQNKSDPNGIGAAAAGGAVGGGTFNGNYLDWGTGPQYNYYYHSFFGKLDANTGNAIWMKMMGSYGYSDAFLACVADSS